MTIDPKNTLDTWTKTPASGLNIQWTWVPLPHKIVETTSQAQNAVGTVLNPKIQKILNSDLEGSELVALIKDWNIQKLDIEIVELLKYQDLINKLNPLQLKDLINQNRFLLQILENPLVIEKLGIFLNNCILESWLSWEMVRNLLTEENLVFEKLNWENTKFKLVEIINKKAWIIDLPIEEVTTFLKDTHFSDLSKLDWYDIFDFFIEDERFRQINNDSYFREKLGDEITNDLDNRYRKNESDKRLMRL